MVAPVLSGHLVGYARVSTDDQDLSLQIDSLTGLGIDQENIFTEKISGAKTDRPQLDACLAKLQQGDTLVVWRLDRLGRSMHHLVELKSCGIAGSAFGPSATASSTQRAHQAN